MAAQLQEAMQELKVRAEKLERSNRDLEQFAYAASHDLQTPLRKVKSFSMLLREELAPLLEEVDEEKRQRIEKYLDFVTQGSEQSQQLIDGLLSFSRTGRNIDRSVVDLDDCLDAALFILSDDIREKGVTIKRTPLPTELVDESLMTRVFQNLVGNAIKFRAQERAPEVEVGAEDDADRHTIFVKDNGIGIDDRHSERVFVIFQRIGTQKNGAGLGLALVKKIVESHGGAVWFESTPGEGTTFKFTLPKVLDSDVRLDDP